MEVTDFFRGSLIQAKMIMIRITNRNRDKYEYPVQLAFIGPAVA
jgi:hypothetical protein